MTTDRFYADIPAFRGFTSLMDPALYRSLPDDWTVGIADIVQSTKAIQDNRYKAVNTAGAAVIAPDPRADAAAVRSVIEDVVAMVEGSAERSSPLPPGGPTLRWPPQGIGLEARARGGRLRWAIASALLWTLFYFLIFRSGVRVGNFVPGTYIKQVVENSDFRKFDDGLRMILDCPAELADRIEARLERAAGIVRFGLHREAAAMMTCFTPSPSAANHVHFIDGARGGYASAATAMKSKRAAAEIS